ncbi:hypothetical protein L1887_14792 [Cichorium endivia]|nr:hypothetical protein L1887_14792 [Cichorium endivia]
MSSKLPIPINRKLPIPINRTKVSKLPISTSSVSIDFQSRLDSERLLILFHQLVNSERLSIQKRWDSRTIGFNNDGIQVSILPVITGTTCDSRTMGFKNDLRFHYRFGFSILPAFDLYHGIKSITRYQVGFVAIQIV